MDQNDDALESCEEEEEEEELSGDEREENAANSPGSYVRVPIEATEGTAGTAHERGLIALGAPLLSAPRFVVWYLPEAERGEQRAPVAVECEFLVPQKDRWGQWVCGARVGGGSFSLASVTEKGHEDEQYVTAMLEDFAGWGEIGAPELAEWMLILDTAARSGDEAALTAVACAEIGIFLWRVAGMGDRRRTRG